MAFGGGRLYIADTGGWVTAIDEASLQVANQFPGPLPNQSFGHDESKRLSADGQRTPSGSDPVRLGAIAYWPATAKLSRAKLLVLTDTTISDVERPNIVQLAQWDAETGHEDWATSLSACRSGRGSQQSKYGLGLAVSTPPDQPDEIPRIMARIRLGERVEHFETRRVRKDGREIDVSATISLMESSPSAEPDCVGLFTARMALRMIRSFLGDIFM